MISFPIRTEEPTTIRLTIRNMEIRMQRKLLSVSMRSMGLRTRRKRSSLASTTPIEKEITMRSSTYPPMLAVMTLKSLTENWLCNTIPRLMKTMKKQEENLTK